MSAIFPVNKVMRMFHYGKGNSPKRCICDGGTKTRRDALRVLPLSRDRAMFSDIPLG